MGHFQTRMQEGSVLLLQLCTKFEADRSIYSKVIRGSQILEIGSRDPGHAQLGVVLWSICRRGTTSNILSSSNIQNGDILVPANPGTPGKMAVKTECV